MIPAQPDLFPSAIIPARFEVGTRVIGLVAGESCRGVVERTHEDGNYTVRYDTARRPLYAYRCYMPHTLEQPTEANP